MGPTKLPSPQSTLPFKSPNARSLLPHPPSLLAPRCSIVLLSNRSSIFLLAPRTFLQVSMSHSTMQPHRLIAFGVILATAASSIVVAIYVILRQSPSVFVSLASKGSQRPRAFIKGFHPHSRPAVAAFLRRFDTAKIALATSQSCRHRVLHRSSHLPPTWDYC